MARALVVAALAACAHRQVPVVTSTDPELCVEDVASPATHVAPHGDRVGICYGDVDCLVVDHVRGQVVARAHWPHPEQGLPPPLALVRPVERFEVQRTETETSVCDRDGVCRTLRLPNIEDQFTVMPAISANGNELYYVAREGDNAYLDTIGVDPRARRLGRVKLAVGNAQDHFFSVDRVGSAVLVRDTVSLSLDDQRTAVTLIAPLTGARRELLGGSAVALDDETALVIEGRHVTILETRALQTIASHTEPGKGDPESTAAPVAGKVAVVAFTNPPTFVTIENRRFTRFFRLPICR